MDVEIGELLPIIRAKASEAFGIVLGLELVSKDPWNLVSRVENPCDFGATVGFAIKIACLLQARHAITGSPFFLFATPPREYAGLNPYEQGKI